MTPRKLVLAMLAAGCMLGSAVPAQAATGMEIGVQDDAVFLTQAYFNRNAAFDRIAQLRATRLRVNVLWSNVVGSSARSRRRPSNVRYDFTSYDSLVNAARARGVRLQLTLTGPAPAWAAGDRKVGPYKPNVKYFGEFVRATAQHFNGLVDRYSIWNEANLAPWLAPLNTAPRQYRSLYATGYREIKRVNPFNQVLIGETSPYGTRGRSTPPITFLRGVLKSGGLLADGYAHHPYDFQHAPNYRYPGSTNATLGTIKNLTKELDRQARAKRLRTPGGQKLDVWLTEYGYLRAGRYRKPERTRGKYLRQAYGMALSNPRIRQMLQFVLVEPGRKYAFFDMSLLNRSNQGGVAFDQLADWANDNQARLAR